MGFKQTVRTTHTVLNPPAAPHGAHLSSLQVHKLLIVVELLLGEIPDRLQFRQPSLKRSLMPYFLLTQGQRSPVTGESQQQEALLQALTLCVCVCVYSGEDGEPGQVQPGVGAVWGEVPDGWNLHTHHPTETQRHQDR